MENVSRGMDGMEKRKSLILCNSMCGDAATQSRSHQCFATCRRRDGRGAGR